MARTKWALALMGLIFLAAPVMAMPVLNDGLGALIPTDFSSWLGSGIQDKPVDIDVQIGQKSNDSGWVVSPVWMAIGGIAILLLIVLIVMAVRGGQGGTTVVRP